MTTTPLTGTAPPTVTQVPRDGATPYARRWRALVVVLVAMFMAQFDLYVVNVAVPLLQHDLRASQGALELIVAGYAFMYASGLVLGGRLGDLVGHRRMFMAGMLTFAAASLLCGLAQSADQLVGARLLQGLTAAAMVPQVLALITEVFSGRERAKAISWFGVTIGVGAVAGQVLGGVLFGRVHAEGLATHGDPESCVGAREGDGEALTGARVGRAMEPRNHRGRGADVVYGDGRQHHQQRYCERLADPARSENHGMHGTSLRENREISCSPVWVITRRAAQERPRPYA